MVSTVYRPREIKKGLHAEYIQDHNDYFAMVSLDIRFAEPDKNEHIDEAALFTIEKLFAVYLINNNLKDDIIHLGPIGDSGIFLNLSCTFDVENSLELVKNMCRFILNLGKREPIKEELICKIQSGFDASKKVISEYLSIVDNNYVIVKGRVKKLSFFHRSFFFCG